MLRACACHLVSFNRKVSLAGAWTNKASVVPKEHVGVVVAKVGCGVCRIFGEFVFVAGITVAHDVVGPGDASGFNERSEAFLEAVAGEAAKDAVFAYRVLIEDGTKVVVDGDGARRMGLANGFGDEDVVAFNVCLGELLAFVWANASKKADGNIGHQCRVGLRNRIQEGLGVFNGEDLAAGSFGSGEFDFGAGVEVGIASVNGPAEEGGEDAEVGVLGRGRLRESQWWKDAGARLGEGFVFPWVKALEFLQFDSVSINPRVQAYYKERDNSTFAWSLDENNQRILRYALEDATSPLQYDDYNGWQQSGLVAIEQVPMMAYYVGLPTVAGAINPKLGVATSIGVKTVYSLAFAQETRDNILRRGGDPVVAWLSGLASGAAQSALEASKVEMFFGKGLTEAAYQAARAQWVKTVAAGGMRQALKRFGSLAGIKATLRLGGAAAANSLLETVQEGMQKAAEGLSTNTALVLSDGSDSAEYVDVPGEVWEEMKNVAGGMFLMQGVTTSLGAVADKVKGDDLLRLKLQQGELLPAVQKIVEQTIKTAPQTDEGKKAEAGEQTGEQDVPSEWAGPLRDMWKSWRAGTKLDANTRIDDLSQKFGLSRSDAETVARLFQVEADIQRKHKGAAFQEFAEWVFNGVLSPFYDGAVDLDTSNVAQVFESMMKSLGFKGVKVENAVGKDDGSFVVRFGNNDGTIEYAFGIEQRVKHNPLSNSFIDSAFDSLRKNGVIEGLSLEEFSNRWLTDSAWREELIEKYQIKPLGNFDGSNRAILRVKDQNGNTYRAEVDGVIQLAVGDGGTSATVVHETMHALLRVARDLESLGDVVVFDDKAKETLLNIFATPEQRKRWKASENKRDAFYTIFSERDKKAGVAEEHFADIAGNIAGSGVYNMAENALVETELDEVKGVIAHFREWLGKLVDALVGTTDWRFMLNAQGEYEVTDTYSKEERLVAGTKGAMNLLLQGVTQSKSALEAQEVYREKTGAARTAQREQAYWQARQKLQEARHLRAAAREAEAIAKAEEELRKAEEDFEAARLGQLEEAQLARERAMDNADVALHRAQKKRTAASNAYGEWYRKHIATIQADEYGKVIVPEHLKRQQKKKVEQIRKAKSVERKALEEAASAGLPGAGELLARAQAQETFDRAIAKEREILRAEQQRIKEVKPKWDWPELTATRVLGHTTLMSKTGYIKHLQTHYNKTKAEAESAATALYPMEFDNVPWLNSTLYSGDGGHSPDTAAQALYDEGLIEDADIDSLWEAIAGDLENVRLAKKRMEDEAFHNFSEAVEHHLRVRNEAMAAIDAWEQNAAESDNPLDWGLFAVSSRGSTEDYLRAQREYDEVVARYTNPDGTKKAGWMKAPNGKPTNLTERQWVQVRTPSFKRWFGDWEALAELEGSTLDEAKTFLKTLMKTHQEIRTSDGALLRMVSQSAKAFSKEAEIQSSNKEAHWCALRNIESIIGRSRFLYEEAPRNGSTDIQAYVKYGSIFTFKGEQYLAKITSKKYPTVETQNFYNVESVNVQKIVDRGIHEAIGKGQPLDAIDTDNITKLLFDSNPSSVSKVIDENGEPLVVYRGAPYDPLAQEAGKGVIAPERYFTPDEQYAKRYEKGDGVTRAYFLNIRNPFDVRNERDAQRMLEIRGGHDFHTGISGALDWAEAPDAEELNDLWEGEYDGLILDEGGDPSENGPIHRGISYVPFNGGAQVKSATDNVGTFDGTENDVRYSIALDSTHRDLYERYKAGDESALEEARQMVREAAAKAMPYTKVVDEDGLPLVVYHGTANGGAFTAFDVTKLSGSTLSSQKGAGFYFTNAKSGAQEYLVNMDPITGRIARGRNPHLFEVFLNIRNPIMGTQDLDKEAVKKLYLNADEWFIKNWIPSSLYSFWDTSKNVFNGVQYNSKEELATLPPETLVSLYLEKNKYRGTTDILQDLVRAYGSSKQDKLLEAMRDILGADGVIAKGVRGLNQYIAWSPNQIKSADPFTFDDAGNLIPLSERFNLEKDDVRYSVVSINGRDIALLENEPLTKNEAQDEEKVREVLATVIGKSFPQQGEETQVEITKHFADEFWGSNTSTKLRDKLDKLWRAKVGTIPIIGDILKTTPLGPAEVAKHINAKFKERATFYRCPVEFGIKRWNGIAIYKCDMLILEMTDNGRRYVYDFVKINKPTLTAKSSLNSDLAQRLYGQAGLTGESVLNSHTIPNSGADVNEKLYAVTSRRPDLVGLHNMSAEGLKGADELGGFAMPSIAITKDSMGHNEFGDISLLMRTSAYDPKVNSKNKLYSRDAWTPTFPGIINKPNIKHIVDVSERLLGTLPDDVRKAIGHNETYRLLYEDGIQEKFTSSSTAGDAYGTNAALKAAYLIAKGEALQPVMKPRTFLDRSNSRVLSLGEDGLRLINETIGDMLVAFHSIPGAERIDWIDQHASEIEEAFIDAAYTSRIAKNPDVAEFTREEVIGNLFKKKPLGFADVIDLADAVAKLRKAIAKGEADAQTVDEYATKRAIDERVPNHDLAFESWLNEQYGDPILARGIRNNKDYYTSSGKRRSWDALHDPVTLANVVKVMLSKQRAQGEGFLGANPFGLTAAKFKSLKDVIKNEDLLKELPKEEMDAIRDGFIQAFSEISERYSKTWKYHDDNPWTAIRQSDDALLDAWADSKGTIEGLKRELNGYGRMADDDLIRDFKELMDGIAKFPTNYFEAKPMRGVGFEEVAAAIIPDNASEETREILQRRGIPTYVYIAGNVESRLIALNLAADQTDDTRFSIESKPLVDDAEFNYPVASRNLASARRAEAEAKRAMDAANRQYHITSMANAMRNGQVMPGMDDLVSRPELVTMMAAVAMEAGHKVLPRDVKKFAKGFGISVGDAEAKTVAEDINGMLWDGSRGEKMSESAVSRGRQRSPFERNIGLAELFADIPEDALTSVADQVQRARGVAAGARAAERLARDAQERARALAEEVAARTGFTADDVQQLAGFDIVDTVLALLDSKAKMSKEEREAYEKRLTEAAQKRAASVKAEAVSGGVALDVEVDADKLAQYREIQKRLLERTQQRALDRQEKLELAKKKAAERKAQQNEEGDSENADVSEEDETLDAPNELFNVAGVTVDLLDPAQLFDFVVCMVADQRLNREGNEDDLANLSHDPRFARDVTLTMSNVTRRLADALCYGAAREKAMQYASDLGSATTLRQAELLSVRALNHIHKSMIRETRKTLIKAMLDGGEVAVGDGVLTITGVRQAIKKGRFVVGEHDYARKVNGEIEAQLRAIKRVLKLGSLGQSRLDAECKDTLARVLAGSPDKSNAEMNRDYREAERLQAALNSYGGLMYAPVAQIVYAAQQLSTFINDELVKQAEKVAAREMQIEADVKVFVAAMDANAGKYKPHEKQKTWRIKLADKLDSLVGLQNLVWERLGGKAEGNTRTEYNALTRRLQNEFAEAAQRERALNNAYMKRIDSILQKAYESASKGLEHLAELIPEKHNAIITGKIQRDKDGTPMEGKVAHQRERLTYGQVLQLYLSCRQEDYKGNLPLWARDGEAFAAMQACVTAEDLKFATLAQSMLREAFPELQKTYAQIVGYKVGTTPDYWPVKIHMERDRKPAEARVFTPFVAAMQPRVRHGLDFDERASALEMLVGRFGEYAHMLAYGEKSEHLVAVLGDHALRRSVRNAHGEDALKQLDEMVADTLLGLKSENGKLLQVAMLTASVSGLGFNPTSALKQSFSWMAMANRLGIGNAAKFWAGNLFDVSSEEARYLKQCDGYKARYGSVMSNAVLESMFNNPDVSKAKMLKRKAIHTSMWLIQHADWLASRAVALGAFKTKIGEYEVMGYNRQEAMRLAAVETFDLIETTMQTGQTMHQTHLDKHNQLWRMFAQFGNASLQQSQYTWRSLAGMLRGEKGQVAKFMRTSAVNGLVGVMMEFALQLMQAVLQQGLWDDEEDDQEQVLSIAARLTASFFLPATVLPFAGGVITFAINKAFGANTRLEDAFVPPSLRTLQGDATALYRVLDAAFSDHEKLPYALHRLGRALLAPYRTATDALEGWTDWEPPENQ